MGRGVVLSVAVLLAGTAANVTFADVAGARPASQSYIVVLADDADAGRDSHALARAHGGQARYVYDEVLNGFNFVGSEQAARNLARNPKVESVAPDGEARIFAQTEPTGTDRIDADVSRSANTGAGVVVAVIDTGIDLDHPDLDANVDTANDKDCYNGDFVADDDNGHGTHVAGTIGAENNSEGVVGVAPGATLVPIKVLSSSGSGSWSSVICGIDHATAIGADVANMSLGGDGSDTVCDDKSDGTYSDALHEALCDSVAAGVTHVVAAGNDSDDAKNHVPAAFDEAITVSSFTDLNGAGGSSSGCESGGPPWARECDETMTYFSNHGNDVVIAAPGDNIYSTDTGATYSTKSGTSMASPHVAGVAALIKAAQPTASPSTVASTITSNGECYGTTELSGSDGLCSQKWPDDPDDKAEPLVDAEAVVAAVGGGGSNAAPVAGDDGATANEDTSVAVDVLANDTDDDGDPLSVSSVSDPANGTATINADDTVTYAPAADFNGDDSFSYTVSDGNGGSDTGTVSVTVTAVNDAPVANGDSYTAEKDTTLSVASPGILGNDGDVDADSLTAAVATGPGNGSVTVNADGSFAYTPNSGYTGSDSFTYTASDGTLNDTATVDIQVQAASTLAVTSIDPTSMQAGTSVSVTIAGSGFEAGATLVLENGSGPAPDVSNVVMSTDGTSITATITAKDGGPPRDRIWDVTVANPSGASATLAQSFTVAP